MKILIVFSGGHVERVVGPPGVAVEHRTLVLDTPSLTVAGSDGLKHAEKWLAEPEPPKPMDLCGWSMFELGKTAGFKRTCATDKTWWRFDGRGPLYGKWQAWLEDGQLVAQKHLPVDADRVDLPGGPDADFEISFRTPQCFIRWAADLP